MWESIKTYFVLFVKSLFGFAKKPILDVLTEKYGQETVQAVLKAVLDVEKDFTKADNKMEKALEMAQPFVHKFGEKAIKSLIEYLLHMIEEGEMPWQAKP